MKLHQYLTQDACSLELKSQTKGDAIRELALRLQGHPEVVDFDGLLEAILVREAEGSTAVGHGVAVPHARTDAVRGFVATVGRSASGIDCDAADGRPVRLFILMGIPTTKVKDYLKLLAHLSLLIKRSGLIESALEAPDAESLIAAFASCEQ